MADIRIKDLATTATTTASDDFMAVDGTTNGTRKMNAAAPAFLTSVTTPSLTAPASTNLTLATGTSGAAVTVLSASNNVGIGTTTPAYRLSVLANTATTVGTKTTIEINSSYGLADPAGQTLIAAEIDSATGGDRGTALTFSTGRQGVGITEKLRIASSGTVSIASTTAGSSGAGALVVAGGISAGNTGSAASYFGGAVTVTGNLAVSGTQTYFTLKDAADPYYDQVGVNAALGTGTNRVWYNPLGKGWIWSNGGTSALTLTSAGAATFAGAVTIGNTVNTVSPTSPNRTITMVVGGVTLYIAAKTTND